MKLIKVIFAIMVSSALLIPVSVPVAASTDATRVDVASLGADQLRVVLQLQLEIADKLGITSTQERIIHGLDQLGSLSEEDAGLLSGLDTLGLAAILQILNESLGEELVDSAATPVTRIAPVLQALSTPLTEPNYFSDAACPFGERNDALSVFISSQALFIAETIREEASRACNQIVVVAGFGANGSLACLISDAVYIVAKEVHEVLTFCNATVDAAEIEGAFERTADIFANLNEHDTDIKALLDDLQDAVDENTRRLGEVISLLHTPEGMRSSPTMVCDGLPCEWPFKPSTWPSPPAK